MSSPEGVRARVQPRRKSSSRRRLTLVEVEYDPVAESESEIEWSMEKIDYLQGKEQDILSNQEKIYQDGRDLSTLALFPLSIISFIIMFYPYVIR